MKSAQRRSHYDAVMTATGAELLGLRSVEEITRLLGSRRTHRAKLPRDGIDSLREYWPDLAIPSLAAQRRIIFNPAGSGKTMAFLDVLSTLCSRPEIFAQLFAVRSPAAHGSTAQSSCDCPACAAFGATARCAASPDRFGSRLSFKTWKTDPAGFVAPHVMALMDAPAMAVAEVLDEWADTVYGRAHRVTDHATARMASFHLISPWILLLDRLLILSWRTGTAHTSRIGLARVKRRSRDFSMVGEVKRRPRCGGRAPRGPSALRMSHLVVIRGGVPART